MTQARNIADMLNSSGDINTSHLDNAPAADWNSLLNKPTLATSATTDTTNADNISSGTLAVARIGTGTKNSTTYLRGDGNWVANCQTKPNCTTNGYARCANCTGTLKGASGSASIWAANNSNCGAAHANLGFSGTNITIGTSACDCACDCACNC